MGGCFHYNPSGDSFINKFKHTENFKLFVKDENWKMKVYKIAEFVKNYLKKKYPNEKFEIVLDYDGLIIGQL